MADQFGSSRNISCLKNTIQKLQNKGIELTTCTFSLKSVPSSHSSLVKEKLFTLFFVNGSAIKESLVVLNCTLVSSNVLDKCPC